MDNCQLINITKLKNKNKNWYYPNTVPIHTHTPIINLLFDLQNQQISISKFNLHSKKFQQHFFIQKNYPTNYKLSLS
jgi:hypothetical protein